MVSESDAQQLPCRAVAVGLGCDDLFHLEHDVIILKCILVIMMTNAIVN